MKVLRQGIFDIQTFSLHDGPGIRTTVFLKGCPLRCRWCSNPEGFEAGPTLSFQQRKCTDCLDCVDNCPTDALSILDGKLVVQHDECNACGECVKICPTDALKLIGYETTPEVILENIKKDRSYFEKSGGGITLSGGEVMMQIDFARDILKLAKAEKIHTCIETGGVASQEAYESILPFVDLFLFDYKITDHSTHKKYTGVSNDKILANLEFLDSRGAKIVLRVPIIPGINDVKGHFAAIVEISNRYSGIEKVDVMPYHNWGQHKYEEIGWPSPYLDVESVSPSMAQMWVEEIKAMGGKNVVLS